MTTLGIHVKRAQQDRLAHRITLRRIIVENGLSIVLFTLFASAWIGQSVVGWYAHNQDLEDHHQPRIAFSQYLASGHFLEATSENWESEFLQMAAFVWLTAILFQKGSPESKDPYEPEQAPPVTSDSPWPVRKGGIALRLYEQSLGLSLFILFLISFFLHVAGGAREYNREQLLHGQPGVSFWQYMGTSQFWFESLQNWQSEFLSILCMVVLAIFLRQKGSAESKPVPAPHAIHE